MSRPCAPPLAADPLGKRPWLPGEHGFRFFPNFYRHITDTLARIPYGAGTVADNLVDTTQVLIATYDKAGIELPSRFPENAYELATALKIVPLGDLAAQRHSLCGHRAFRGLRLADHHLVRGAAVRGIREDRLVGLCRRRRAVRGLSEASGHRDHPLAGCGQGRRWPASRRSATSSFSCCFGILTPGTASDRLLNGPTNDVWIKPWLEHLQAWGWSTAWAAR